MKKISLTLILVLMLCLLPQNINADNNPIESSTTPSKEEELYKNSILSLIYPYVLKAVENYYGYPKQFDLYDAKILSIERKSERFEFDITVQVITFTGAHNPPRGLETITVRTSPMGNEVIYFNHKALDDF